MKALRERLRREESGFTLAEMLVTIMMMITVMFALYSIFDMGLRVFSFGSDKLDVTENARVGMERMSRELRAAYPSDKAAGKTNLFWSEDATCASSDPTLVAMPAADEVTFGNDRNGNRAIKPNSDSAGSTDSQEEITYKLAGAGAPYTLERVLYTYDPGTDTCAYTSSTLVDSVQAFNLTYLKGDGTTALTASELADATNEPLISSVRIELTLEICRSGLGCTAQALRTDVALRNRMRT